MTRRERFASEQLAAIISRQQTSVIDEMTAMPDVVERAVLYADMLGAMLDAVDPDTLTAGLTARGLMPEVIPDE